MNLLVFSHDAAGGLQATLADECRTTEALRCFLRGGDVVLRLPLATRPVVRTVAKRDAPRPSWDALRQVLRSQASRAGGTESGTG